MNVLFPSFFLSFFLSFFHSQVYGVTMNFTYTDMESIEERLKATGVHETTSEDVLFLLAVHCEPFPGGVVSVWVFYGSLPRIVF